MVCIRVFLFECYPVPAVLGDFLADARHQLARADEVQQIDERLGGLVGVDFDFYNDCVWHDFSP
jgi:hypothetical protein